MKTVSLYRAGALALVMSLPALAPAEAAPAINADSQGMFQTVQYNMNNNGPRLERRGNYTYYNGQRGSRDRRPGYRYYGGLWFPPAAFLAGAIFGGVLGSGAYGYSGNPHVQWCYSQYRSYRQWDNTYQPNYGPRRLCVSPY